MTHNEQIKRYNYIAVDYIAMSLMTYVSLKNGTKLEDIEKAIGSKMVWECYY